jgi:uncharacterized membrane protein YkvI
VVEAVDGGASFQKSFNNRRSGEQVLLVCFVVQYVGYNITVVPAVLFCRYRQSRRSVIFGSGALSGLSMTVPFALTFACLMRFWPDPLVIDAEVPWLPMLTAGAEGRGGAGLWIGLFGIVAGWTLLETAVGSIHALIDRVERNLVDLPRAWRPRSGELTPWQLTVASLALLALAAGLSTIGIVDLIAGGYGTLASVFILFVVLPLLTVGVWKITRSNRKSVPDNS